MTEDDIKKFLEENRADIALSIKGKVIEAMTSNLRYSLPESTHKVVNEFLETEIVPEIKKHLNDNKGAILEAAIKAAATVGDEIAKVLVTRATENLKGYNANGIAKALFGY